MDMNQIKQGLNSDIENDKKHIRIYDKPFSEYDKAKNDGVDLFFEINNKTLKVLKHVVVKNENNISNSSFYINVLSEINKLEDNQYTSWIIDHLEYLRNRIYSIHENRNDVHLYQFKLGTPSSKDIILKV